MSNQLNVSVLVAARDEYSDQLKRHLQPLIQEGFSSIYEDSVSEDEYNPLKQFQIFLKQIPSWNQSILDQETTRIKEKCPYLMDMVTAIFVSHVKILASVRLGGKHSNIKIKIPTPEIFIHSVYVAGAECFYYSPEPFEDSLDRDNTEKIKDTINTNIDNTISAMIPIQSILQEYLCNTFTEHVTPSAQPEPIQQDDNNDIGDILSGSDIMDDIPTASDNKIDSGYESEKSDLSELFTPDPESNTNIDDSDVPIFPIGDTAPFEDKIKDDDFNLDNLNLDNLNLDEGDGNFKEIPVTDDGLGFLGSTDDDFPTDTGSSDIPDIPDFTDSIPLDQENFGFNDTPGDSALESDFNFFDTNDIL